MSSTQVAGPANIYDAAGALAIAGANLPVGAAAGAVLTSDAAGRLSLQPPANAAYDAYLLRVFAV